MFRRSHHLDGYLDDFIAVAHVPSAWTAAVYALVGSYTMATRTLPVAGESSRIFKRANALAAIFGEPAAPMGAIGTVGWDQNVFAVGGRNLSNGTVEQIDVVGDGGYPSEPIGVGRLSLRTWVAGRVTPTTRSAAINS